MIVFPPMLSGGDNFWDEPDHILMYLISTLVNTMGVEVGITLMVRGLVVSGTLVSEQAYLDNVTETLQQQIDFSGKDTPEDAQAALKDLLDLRRMGEVDPLTMVSNAMEDIDFSIPDEASDGDEADEYDTDDDLDDLPMVLQYLHLKDPMVVAGEPSISFNEGSDVVLRLRLTAVDGWMIGRLLPDIPNFPDFGSSDDIAH